MKQRIWFSVGLLSLLPFFQHFRDDSPHQLAAIKELEESIDPKLLETDADWFESWKASGYDQEIFMPYFSQNDDKHEPYRRCFSSAAAMVAAYYKKVKTDDEYNQIRAKFGDTTSVQAQLEALRSLGLNAEYRQDGDAELVELELENGRPVMVGYYHHGDISLGHSISCGGMGCGHWAVISGYYGKNSADPGWVLQDPRGEPNLIKGGHKNPHKGRDVKVLQREFKPRWEVEGSRTGWVILVDDL
jgi:hypothetical protein